MTGPEHYAAAERLLANAERHNTEHPSDMRIAEICAHTAQVHATLAVAAATALVDETPRSDSHSEYRAWSQVAGSDYRGPGAIA